MSSLFTAVSAEQQEIVAGGKIVLKDININFQDGNNNTYVADVPGTISGLNFKSIYKPQSRRGR
ncbi:hypothetical protein [Anabaena sp. AL93]|uniref:hypothetical protein n=1 Tax=Anabaena sp. AL93 TaxID=1678133 RepID=UPI0008022560|nr:hypothetical protein [Anabaena sp. AL93]OBQ15572.1 MAG: hypothetical protein AN486_22775 [Anabaena sp. AL93]